MVIQMSLIKKKGTEMNNKKLSLSESLRDLRISKGMTQKDLASKLGIDQGVVSKYESAQRTPGPDRIEMLQSFFEVSIDTLMGFRNDD